jgi:hypothetical protein
MLYVVLDVLVWAPLSGPWRHNRQSAVVDRCCALIFVPRVDRVCTKCQSGLLPKHRSAAIEMDLLFSDQSPRRIIALHEVKSSRR